MADARLKRISCGANFELSGGQRDDHRNRQNAQERPDARTDNIRRNSVLGMPSNF